MGKALLASPRRIALLTIGALLALSARDGWAQDGLTPLQVAQTEAVTSVAISDDGRYLAYVARAHELGVEPIPFPAT
jgi:hypothetical protein